LAGASAIVANTKGHHGMRWIAVLPFLGILVGTPFFNRAEPSVLGLPLILAWLVSWVLATSVIMAIVYWFDPVNRGDAQDPISPRSVP